jgi:hypothetical protein
MNKYNNKGLKHGFYESYNSNGKLNLKQYYL